MLVEGSGIGRYIYFEEWRETRNEAEYPVKTIYEMMYSLQCYLRFQRKKPLFPIDKKGCDFVI